MQLRRRKNELTCCLPRLNGATIIDGGEQNDGNLDENASDDERGRRGLVSRGSSIQSSLAAHEALF
jgi:hypothetical protein